MTNNLATTTSIPNPPNHPCFQSLQREWGIDPILRQKTVCSLLSIGKSKLHTMIRDGHFPRPIVLGPAGSRAVGWKTSQVKQWIDERQEAMEVTQ